eukprot:4901033-Lingulodinium_polyedra.AAC.1
MAAASSASDGSSATVVTEDLTRYAGASLSIARDEDPRMAKLAEACKCHLLHVATDLVKAHMALQC